MLFKLATLLLSLVPILQLVQAENPATLHTTEPVAARHEVLQRSLEARTWAAQTRGLLDDFSTCEGCQNILSLIKGLVKDDDSSLISLGKQLCAMGTNYDTQFCNGTIDREAPVIADIVRNMAINSTASIQFCITFLGVCSYPKVDHWTVPSLSSKPCDTKTESKSSGKKPIKVVHYSDIHIDPLYVQGSSTKCQKPTCCRPFSKDDAPGITKNPAGPNGDHNCDSPVTLEASMYKAIKDMFPDQAFTIFTGDIVDHSLFNTSKSYNLGEIEKAYERMDDNFKHVYGTAGNHEAHPANIFEPESQGNSTQWVYDALSEKWSSWIDKDATNDAKAMGAYSTKYPNGNLRIISLNTNLYYRFNFILYQNQMERDPDGQITWLAKELAAAESAGENVYIIGHMPFGEADALPDQSNYLDQVVKRYSSTIKAMFFGHTHVDHFEISYADYAHRSESNALAISYICPSLTPTSGQPSFRVYDVDPDSFAVLDATTYYADMDSKSFQTTGPVWKKYYSAKEVYGTVVSPPVTDAAAELTPAFWHKVTAAMEKNTTLFDEYIARKSRGWKSSGNATPCRDDCLKREICQLRAARSQDNCNVLVPGVHFAKREDPHRNQHGEHDHCGTSVTQEIFHAVARRQDLLELLQERFLAEGREVDPIEHFEDVNRRDASDEAQTTADECVSTSPTGGSQTSSGPDSTETNSGPALQPLALNLLVLIGVAIYVLT